MRVAMMVVMKVVVMVLHWVEGMVETTDAKKVEVKDGYLAEKKVQLMDGKKVAVRVERKVDWTAGRTEMRKVAESVNLREQKKVVVRVGKMAVTTDNLLVGSMVDKMVKR